MLIFKGGNSALYFNDGFSVGGAANGDSAARFRAKLLKINCVIDIVNARGKIYISVCGFVSYGIYLSVLFLGYSEILAAFASASFVAIASEILARVLKAPTVIFTVVGIVPIVPGSALYYSMRNLLLRDIDGFFDSLKSACSITAGIVFGIVAISALMKLLTSLKKKN